MLARKYSPLWCWVLAMVLAANLALTVGAQDYNSSPDYQELRGTPETFNKLSPELRERHTATPWQRVRVIVQTQAAPEALANRLAARGGQLERALPLINGYVAEVPNAALLDLAIDADTQFISLDRPTFSLQQRYDHNLVLATTGAKNVVGNNHIDNADDPAIRRYLEPLPKGVNGTDITIAMLDSGIYDTDSVHQDLRSMEDADDKRILKHVNFVSSEHPTQNQIDNGYDPYGHGTHVAGIAAGSGYESIQAAAQVGNTYSGVAFNANLLDLRVIGADGSGTISDVISAINWMISNRMRYNIRVANFSIGAAVTQSYRTDPLCQAVERAVNAGIVCVVAAGNFGKDASGAPVYGSILAPGNSPAAITVGALNTQGSAQRSDDAVASYSSRGPTLVDYVTKPDVVAPGTLIRSIAANRNALAVQYGLTVYSSNNEDVYMKLSGTSMATPVVSGAVALMLDANPDLTPAMVKSILQFTAQSLPSQNGSDPLIKLLTQGAGSVNIDAAVRLAAAFAKDVDNRKAGDKLLQTKEETLNELLYASQDGTGAFTSQIAGETIQWGNNVFFSEGLAYFYDSNRKFTVYQTNGWQVDDSTTLTRGILFTDGRLLATGRLLAAGRILTSGRLLVSGRILTSGRLLATGWLYDDTSDSIVNISAVQPVWSANLLDQSGLGAESVFDTHAANQKVMIKGERARGFDFPKIKSPTHPLFPGGNH